MVRDVLDVAKTFMRRRQFDKAIKMLDSKADIYVGNFEYYVLFGIACLYIGDTGPASNAFQCARKIKISDTNLLLGQAALFLRRGDTDRAVQYYIDIIENDPENKTALKALEFIRTKGDYNTICKWVDTGKIEEFYPPLGVSPVMIAGIIFPVIACVLGVLLVTKLFPLSHLEQGKRADLTPYVLSVSETQNAQEVDMSSGAYNYILSSKQITDSYDKAMRYIQQYRDNLCQIEINRILCSNASVSIKTKARELMKYLEEPSFDGIKDSPTYKMVAKEPLLYLDCWVSWSGRVSNVIENETGYYCDLLVGYENMENVEGIVPLHFTVIPTIDTTKPVQILARLTKKDDKIALEGRSVFQSVK